MKPLFRLLRLGFLLPVVALTAAPTIEELVADPQRWPREVAVTGSVKATVLRDGRPSGVMLIGAGKRITVTGIAADGVTGKLGGATVKVAVEKTNLLAGGGEAAPAWSEESAAETGNTAQADAAPPGGGDRATAMARQLGGKLVRSGQGRLDSVNTDTALAGVKYYAFYFSASWCGPCRQFTPQFVRYYREMKAKHPEFEVVFMSADRSARDMADYMKQDGMPWLAVKFDLVRTLPEIQRHAGPGIPSLVLMDANGRVLSQTYDGGNYLGPGKVLKDLGRILAKGG